jgi:hypothetical protein
MEIIMFEHGSPIQTLMLCDIKVGQIDIPSHWELEELMWFFEKMPTPVFTGDLPIVMRDYLEWIERQDLYERGYENWHGDREEYPAHKINRRERVRLKMNRRWMSKARKAEWREWRKNSAKWSSDEIPF